MHYKHKVVQGLADLLSKYGGGDTNPVMAAIWFGLKGQIPMFLNTLDNSEEAVAAIERKLREVLDIEEPEPVVCNSPIPGADEEPEPEPKKIALLGKKPPPKRARRKKKGEDIGTEK